jgi:RNA polymerase sigma-70 factor (ECF subfamily)
MQESTDRSLVLRTRDGEVEAYGELVRRYQTSVFNVCYRLLGERREAEDLAQETFIRAYERLRTYDPERPFGPWIRRVAANMCLNHLRSNRPFTEPLDEDHDLPASGPAHDVADVVDRRTVGLRIREAIGALPPRYRAVIELRHFQGLTYEEMAEALSLPLSDVKSHLFRSRRMLAEMLKADV